MPFRIWNCGRTFSRGGAFRPYAGRGFNPRPAQTRPAQTGSNRLRELRLTPKATRMRRQTYAARHRNIKASRRTRRRRNPHHRVALLPRQPPQTAPLPPQNPAPSPPPPRPPLANQRRRVPRPVLRRADNQNIPRAQILQRPRQVPHQNIRQNLRRPCRRLPRRRRKRRAPAPRRKNPRRPKRPRRPQNRTQIPRVIHPVQPHDNEPPAPTLSLPRPIQKRAPIRRNRRRFRRDPLMTRRLRNPLQLRRRNNRNRDPLLSRKIRQRQNPFIPRSRRD